MGWIRVSDDFYDNDKFSEVGPLGVAMHFAAMGFCNRNLTDGFFKKSKARLFLDFDGIGITTATADLCAFGVEGADAARLVIEWMVAADLWHERGHDCDDCHARADGGEPGPREYLVHDYLKFQFSKAQIEEKAEANRKRVEAFRLARKSGNADGNGVGNALRTDVVTEHVQHTPTPTPTPSSFPLVTSGGGVTKVDARGPRPHCSNHPNCNSDGANCRPCMRRRLWDEGQEDVAKADELEQKRQQKEAREKCPRCEGNNTYIGEDGETRKCSPHVKPMEAINA